MCNRDTTLIQPDSGGQELSLGQAWQVFAGRVGPNGGGTIRRGLMRFPVDAVPAGSIVTSVEVHLYMSMGQGGAQLISLRRCLNDWGEGVSFGYGGGGVNPAPGDVTWTKRFWPDIPWTTPGGDFVAQASVTKSVNDQNWYVFGSTPDLVADVQSWVDGVNENFGWVITGNEVTMKTAKRFEARNTPSVGWRPFMVVNFELPPVIGDVNGDGVVNGADIAEILGHWGVCGQTPCVGDLDGNGVVDGADLAVVLGHWS
ncbi:MAG: hypothetical protein KF724_02895 [Phycisphaeraceae bacterium]|nr:hypothetical protein [Phycisphaeraceae bacterium]